MADGRSGAMLILVALLLLSYIALCGFFYLKQSDYLYYPQPRAAHGRETITLPIENGEVLVTVRRHDGPNAALYFGGNAEDVSASGPELARAFPEHALYLMHYRGYGGSSGSPSEAALVADALALFDHARAEHENVLVIGRSLGSSVAIQLAAVRPVSRLVLVTPFESVQSLAAKMLPYLPVRWLLRDKFESGKYAPRVAAPTVVLTADEDEVIPAWSTTALVRQFRPGVATHHVIDGVGHNTISASPDYWRYLTDDTQAVMEQ